MSSIITPTPELDRGSALVESDDYKQLDDIIVIENEYRSEIDVDFNVTVRETLG